MPALLSTAEMVLSSRPDRLVMTVKDLPADQARLIAEQAVREARRKMPKATGASAKRLQPIWGVGYFGILWQDSYVWFQENGITAFTMRSLAGKTIPMWIDDPTGQERARNPKAQVRTTLSGKTQVLIFRKAAQMGQRTTKTRRVRVGGAWVTQEYDAPASYPGAPGRIGVRELGPHAAQQGRVAGQIARGNVGVRWRHPGLEGRMFLNNALTLAAQWNAILPIRVYVADSRWKGMAR